MPELVPIALLERACRDRCDLSSTDLRIVVALVSAKRTGRAGATCKELRELTGMSHSSSMLKLERELWVVAVGKLAGGNEMVWGPSPKAIPRLGLGGWQLRLFTEEELPRVDANLPDYLEPLPEREVVLTGPSIVDATEQPEGERAAS